MGLLCDLGQSRALALFTNMGIGLESFQRASCAKHLSLFCSVVTQWECLGKRGSADLGLTDQLEAKGTEGACTFPA